MDSKCNNFDNTINSYIALAIVYRSIFVIPYQIWPMLLSMLRGAVQSKKINIYIFIYNVNDITVKYNIVYYMIFGPLMRLAFFSYITVVFTVTLIIR